MLAKRDGEFCRHCGKVGISKGLCIDHVDNRDTNNAPDNLQLLCRSCNTKKNPRGEAKREESGKAHFQASSREVELKETYEPMFRQWLAGQVEQYESIELKDAVEAGAEVTGASIQTIERYIRKMTSTAGKFRIVERNNVKYVEFKEWWNPNR